MNDRVLEMPSREEILHRLQAVKIDEPQVRERLFPAISSKLGGKELSGDDVVTVIGLEINDYSKGMPPIDALRLNQMIPQLIELIVDDEEVRRAAFELYDEAKAARKPA